MEYFIKHLDEEVLVNEGRHRDGLSILHAICLTKAAEIPSYGRFLRYSPLLSFNSLLIPYREGGV